MRVHVPAATRTGHRGVTARAYTIRARVRLRERISYRISVHAYTVRARMHVRAPSSVCALACRVRICAWRCAYSSVFMSPLFECQCRTLAEHNVPLLRQSSKCFRETARMLQHARRRSGAPFDDDGCSPDSDNYKPAKRTKTNPLLTLKSYINEIEFSTDNHSRKT